MEDHIAPWKSTYMGRSCSRGPSNFCWQAPHCRRGEPAGGEQVLPLDQRRHTGDRRRVVGERGVTRSWWNEWDAWISGFGGDKVPARAGKWQAQGTGRCAGIVCEIAIGQFDERDCTQQHCYGRERPDIATAKTNEAVKRTEEDAVRVGEATRRRHPGLSGTPSNRSTLHARLPYHESRTASINATRVLLREGSMSRTSTQWRSWKL